MKYAWRALVGVFFTTFFLFGISPLFADIKEGLFQKPPSECAAKLVQLTELQLKRRVDYLNQSIQDILDIKTADTDADTQRFLDQQVRNLTAELKKLESDGVLYEENMLLDTDSYKVSQFKQYSPKLSKVFSYLESRGGVHDRTMVFGLQYILKKYFSKPITVAMVEQAKKFYKAHGEPFNYDGWMYIARELGGRLPIKIRAPKEGSVVPVSNVLMSVESTDPKVHWVVGWFETMLMRTWYPNTVGGDSYHNYDLIYEALLQTSDDPDGDITFKLHDFGSRGVSSRESSAIGGAAHLMNFKGTDNVQALVMLMTYYGDVMPGYSIPASEHSTMTSWGAREGEAAAMENMIDQFGEPGAMFACVSDSYDLWNAIDNIWGTSLKQKLIDSQSTLVVRPDSGHPATVVLEAVKRLEAKFGTTVNKKGFKVLNNVRVLQGDGINEQSIKEILAALIGANYSITNIAFGMGGELLQKPHRDKQQFAFKASWGILDGVPIQIFKDPVTQEDNFSKKSKRGLLDLIRHADGTYETVVGMDYPDMLYHPDSALSVVFENGIVDTDVTTEEVRAQVVIERKARRAQLEKRMQPAI